MKGRFAPSPTGYIHLGNVWIALLSYLSVRQQNGQFVLRIEDIDKQRSKPELANDLLDDLEWLGFSWDEGPRVNGQGLEYFQSQRYAYYEEILDKFRQDELLYPCFCNRAHLQNISSAPHQGESSHSYDGYCRQLTLLEIQQKLAEKNPSWRFKVSNQSIEFNDLFQGKQQSYLQAGLDDFVVKRADGMFAYNLAVVLDDIAMGITEIIRGRDLLETTPLHIFLYHVLSKPIPLYGHAPLLVDKDNVRLSKRQKAITIKELRELGYTPAQILGYLAVTSGLISSKQTVNGGVSLENLVSLVKFPLKLTKNNIQIKDMSNLI